MAKTQEAKANIIREFALNAHDTGSAEVQIALLTMSIRELTNHCQQHPHDYSSNRGLLKMVCQRKRLLRYLEERDEARYKNIINKLGLRK